jgi:hypothetical protein
MRPPNSNFHLRSSVCTCSCLSLLNSEELRAQPEPKLIYDEEAWEVDEITGEYAFPTLLLVPMGPPPKPGEELRDTRTISHSLERRTERGIIKFETFGMRSLLKCGKIIPVLLADTIELVKASYRDIGAPYPFKVVEDFRGHGRSSMVEVCNHSNQQLTGGTSTFTREHVQHLLQNASVLQGMQRSARTASSGGAVSPILVLHVH